MSLVSGWASTGCFDGLRCLRTESLGGSDGAGVGLGEFTVVCVVDDPRLVPGIAEGSWPMTAATISTVRISAFSHVIQPCAPVGRRRRWRTGGAIDRSSRFAWPLRRCCVPRERSASGTLMPDVEMLDTGAAGLASAGRTDLSRVGRSSVSVRSAARLAVGCSETLEAT